MGGGTAEEVRSLIVYHARYSEPVGKKTREYLREWMSEKNRSRMDQPGYELRESREIKHLVFPVVLKGDWVRILTVMVLPPKKKRRKKVLKIVRSRTPTLTEKVETGSIDDVLDILDRLRSVTDIEDDFVRAQVAAVLVAEAEKSLSRYKTDFRRRSLAIVKDVAERAEAERIENVTGYPLHTPRQEIDQI